MLGRAETGRPGEVAVAGEAEVPGSSTNQRAEAPQFAWVPSKKKSQTFPAWACDGRSAVGRCTEMCSEFVTSQG